MGSSKVVWIINEYAGTPYHGMEFRHYYLAKELGRMGHAVTIISSSYSHLFTSLPKKRREIIDGVEYHWLRTFNYGKAHSKTRVLKWILFSIKIFSLPFTHKRPNVILVSPMAPFPILPSWILAKLYGAKLIYEVKDIWPLSLIEIGGFSPAHPIIKLMSYFERFALRQSNEIVSNLQNYGEHIKCNLGISREFHWVSNGVDLEEFKKIELVEDELKNQITGTDKFVVGYAGTIGLANALESFLESAKLLADNQDVLFVLVGDGQAKQKLIDEHGSMSNVLFFDSVPKRQVQSVLQLFDVCFLGWNKERLYKYGTSANKMFDYMLSERPIVNAYSGDGDMVQLANCGISVEAQNPLEIARAIQKMYDSPKEERERMGRNGRKYVLDFFTYNSLAQKYELLF